MLGRGFLIALFIGCFDLISKWYVFRILDDNGGPIEVTSFFNLVMVRNYGISFGMFGDLAYGQIVFSAIAVFIVVILCIWLN